MAGGHIITNPALKPVDPAISDIEVTIEIDELDVTFSAYVINHEKTKKCKAILKENKIAAAKSAKRFAAYLAKKRAKMESLRRARREADSERRQRILENNRRTNESNAGGGVIRNPSTGMITRRS